MKTQKETQEQKLLELLKEGKVNSFDATYIYGIKQAPARIKGLKKQGYTIHKSAMYPNRSVDWSLTELPKERPNYSQAKFVIENGVYKAVI